MPITTVTETSTVFETNYNWPVQTITQIEATSFTRTVSETITTSVARNSRDSIRNKASFSDVVALDGVIAPKGVPAWKSTISDYSSWTEFLSKVPLTPVCIALGTVLVLWCIRSSFKSLWSKYEEHSQNLKKSISDLEQRSSTSERLRRIEKSLKPEDLTKIDVSIKDIMWQLEGDPLTTLRSIVENIEKDVSKLSDQQSKMLLEVHGIVDPLKELFSKLTGADGEQDSDFAQRTQSPPKNARPKKDSQYREQAKDGERSSADTSKSAKYAGSNTPSICATPDRKTHNYTQSSDLDDKKPSFFGKYPVEYPSSSSSSAPEGSFGSGVVGSQGASKGHKSAKLESAKQPIPGPRSIRKRLNVLNKRQDNSHNDPAPESDDEASQSWESSNDGDEDSGTEDDNHPAQGHDNDELDDSNCGNGDSNGSDNTNSHDKDIDNHSHSDNGPSNDDDDDNEDNHSNDHVPDTNKVAKILAKRSPGTPTATEPVAITSNDTVATPTAEFAATLETPEPTPQLLSPPQMEATQEPPAQNEPDDSSRASTFTDRASGSLSLTSSQDEFRPSRDPDVTAAATTEPRPMSAPRPEPVQQQCEQVQPNHSLRASTSPRHIDVLSGIARCKSTSENDAKATGIAEHQAVSPPQVEHVQLPFEQIQPGYSSSPSNLPEKLEAIPGLASLDTEPQSAPHSDVSATSATQSLPASQSLIVIDSEPQQPQGMLSVPDVLPSPAGVGNENIVSGDHTDEPLSEPLPEPEPQQQSMNSLMEDLFGSSPKETGYDYTLSGDTMDEPMTEFSALPEPAIEAEPESQPQQLSSEVPRQDLFGSPMATGMEDIVPDANEDENMTDAEPASQWEPEPEQMIVDPLSSDVRPSPAGAGHQNIVSDDSGDTVMSQAAPQDLPVDLDALRITNTDSLVLPETFDPALQSLSASTPRASAFNTNTASNTRASSATSEPAVSRVQAARPLSFNSSQPTLTPDDLSMGNFDYRGTLPGNSPINSQFTLQPPGQNAPSFPPTSAPRSSNSFGGSSNFGFDATLGNYGTNLPFQSQPQTQARSFPPSTSIRAAVSPFTGKPILDPGFGSTYGNFGTNLPFGPRPQTRPEPSGPSTALPTLQDTTEHAASNAGSELDDLLSGARGGYVDPDANPDAGEGGFIQTEHGGYVPWNAIGRRGDDDAGDGDDDDISSLSSTHPPPDFDANDFLGLGNGANPSEPATTPAADAVIAPTSPTSDEILAAHEEAFDKVLGEELSVEDCEFDPNDPALSKASVLESNELPSLDADAAAAGPSAPPPDTNGRDDAGPSLFAAASARQVQEADRAWADDRTIRIRMEEEAILEARAQRARMAQGQGQGLAGQTFPNLQVPPSPSPSSPRGDAAGPVSGRPRLQPRPPRRTQPRPPSTPAPAPASAAPSEAAGLSQAGPGSGPGAVSGSEVGSPTSAAPSVAAGLSQAVSGPGLGSGSGSGSGEPSRIATPAQVVGGSRVKASRAAKLKRRKI